LAWKKSILNRNSPYRLKFLVFQFLETILEPVLKPNKLICCFHSVFFGDFEGKGLVFFSPLLFFAGFEDSSSVDALVLILS